MRRRARRGQRGQAALEMLGILPLFVMILGAVIQLFLVGYAAVAAEGSARLAARELSQGADPGAARGLARRDAPRVFDASIATSGSNLSRAGDEPAVGGGSEPGAVSARATMTVPFLGIGVDGLDVHVTRYAVFPRTAD